MALGTFLNDIHIGRFQNLYSAAVCLDIIDFDMVCLELLIYKPAGLGIGG